MKKLFLLILVLILCFGAIAITGRISKNVDDPVDTDTDINACAHEDVYYTNKTFAYTGGTHSVTCNICKEVVVTSEACSYGDYEDDLMHSAVNPGTHFILCKYCKDITGRENHTFVDGECSKCGCIQIIETCLINIYGSTYTVDVRLTWEEFLNLYLKDRYAMYSNLDGIYRLYGSQYRQLVDASTQTPIVKTDNVYAGTFNTPLDVTTLWVDYYDYNKSTYKAFPYVEGAQVVVKNGSEFDFIKNSDLSFAYWKTDTGVIYNAGETFAIRNAITLQAVSTAVANCAHDELILSYQNDDGSTHDNICEVCSAVVEDDVVCSTSDVVIYTSSTSSVHSCSCRCGREWTEAHTYSGNTCTKCNYTKSTSSGGTTHTHSWSAWTYQGNSEHTRTCSSCGETQSGTCTDYTCPHGMTTCSVCGGMCFDCTG